jgi:cytochrome b
MKTRIYDLPTRLFHWLFAGSFLTAFTIANTVDDESTAFAWHMLAGLLMVFIVLLRLVWALVGTKHARFSDLQLNPRALLGYLQELLAGNSKRWAGHNPASSWAATLMVLLAIGLGVSGYLMASGSAADELEDLHELLANSFITVVILHLAGLLVHRLQQRDQLAKSMITGDKQGLDQHIPAVRSHKLAGVLFCALVLGFGGYLQQNFVASTATLQLFGTTLQLGEAAETREAEHADTEPDDD